MAMWYTLVCATRVARLQPEPSGAIVLGAILLSGVTIAQVPLWIAKKVFRWRLIRGANGAIQSPQGPWQFNLQHLMLATFLLAVALSPLRRVLPPGRIDLVLFQDVAVVVLGLVVVILCNLLVTVPCIWGAMVSNLASVPLALGWLFYCGILTGVEIGTLGAIFGRPIGPPGGAVRQFAVIFVMNVSQGTTVFGTLLIYRALGFRLVRARPPERNTTGSIYP
jgi:hypothetical protein